MKRFLAFHGDQYYPSGGWDDFAGDFDSKKDAVDSLEARAKRNRPNADPADKWQHQWAHVIDAQTGDQVWSA